jgi:hypothetical protein
VYIFLLQTNPIGRCASPTPKATLADSENPDRVVVDQEGEGEGGHVGEPEGGGGGGECDDHSECSMATQSQAAEELASYLSGVDNGQGQSLLVPEGAFKGWLPRILYTYTLDTLHLPFLRLLSFPVGGTALGKYLLWALVNTQQLYCCGLSSIPCSYIAVGSRQYPAVILL